MSLSRMIASDDMPQSNAIIFYSKVKEIKL